MSGNHARGVALRSDRVAQCLLLAAALTITAAATVDWVTYTGLHGEGVGFFDTGTGTWADALGWRTLRSPLPLRLAAIALAWAQFVLSLRRAHLAAVLALPAALLVAIPISIGSSLIVPWQARRLIQDISIAPALGMWLALADLLLAGVLTTAAVNVSPPSGWQSRQPDAKDQWSRAAARFGSQPKCASWNSRIWASISCSPKSASVPQ